MRMDEWSELGPDARSLSWPVAVALQLRSGKSQRPDFLSLASRLRTFYSQLPTAFISSH